MRRPSLLALAPAAALLAACATINKPLPPSASAFTRFHADVAPYDSAGECVAQPRTSGDRVFAAYFPDRNDARSVVTLVYDDNGKLRAAHEARGVVTVRVRGHQPTQKEIAQAVAVAKDTLRMTLVSLDYRSNRASAENRGAGRDRQRIVGERADADTSVSLGFPAARVRMAARRCGMDMQAQR